MKYLLLIFITSSAFAGIVCRKYDYYQLAGDRKVFEVAVTPVEGDLFNLKISNLYEVRQSDGSYKIRDQALAHNPVHDMKCTQAGENVDAKVITCRKDQNRGFDYLSISRIDRTSIMSAMASTPGKINTYSSYDIEFLEAGGKENTFRQFSLEDCVLQ